ncbi:MAG: hypothetical protein LBG06_11960 [Deltaproteobacteria bacterium]|jgi:hypothetical protein|nr:hypothetical protein [Deltaproteobacteria bacterium]
MGRGKGSPPGKPFRYTGDEAGFIALTAPFLDARDAAALFTGMFPGRPRHEGHIYQYCYRRDIGLRKRGEGEDMTDDAGDGRGRKAGRGGKPYTRVFRDPETAGFLRERSRDYTVRELADMLRERDPDGISWMSVYGFCRRNGLRTKADATGPRRRSVRSAMAALARAEGMLSRLECGQPGHVARRLVRLARKALERAGRGNGVAGS